MPNVSTNDLVILLDNQAYTTSLAIAKGTGVEHASVIKLIRTYQSDLERFGTLRFEIAKSGGRPTEYAILNERQATLVLSYMRNSEIVREFKLRLVSKFYEMAEQLQQPRINRVADASVSLHQAMANMLVDDVGVDRGVAFATAINRIEQDTGIDMSDYRKLLPGRTEPVETLNATQVGQLVGVSARTANRMLEAAGLQCRTRSGKWELTEQGMQYGAAYPYERNGHTDYQIRWGASVVKQLAARH